MRKHIVVTLLITVALIISILLLIIEIRVYPRIDKRIIEEYQGPLINKLDSIIDKIE